MVQWEHVDARDEPGHDDVGRLFRAESTGYIVGLLPPFRRIAERFDDGSGLRTDDFGMCRIGDLRLVLDDLSMTANENSREPDEIVSLMVLCRKAPVEPVLPEHRLDIDGHSGVSECTRGQTAAPLTVGHDVNRVDPAKQTTRIRYLVLVVRHVNYGKVLLLPKSRHVRPKHGEVRRERYRLGVARLIIGKSELAVIGRGNIELQIAIRQMPFELDAAVADRNDVRHRRSRPHDVVEDLQREQAGLVLERPTLIAVPARRQREIFADLRKHRGVPVRQI